MTTSCVEIAMSFTEMDCRRYRRSGEFLQKSILSKDILISCLSCDQQGRKFRAPAHEVRSIPSKELLPSCPSCDQQRRKFRAPTRRRIPSTEHSFKRPP